ncbi:MAG: hypothetical protein DRJ56_06575 [Thermoprotei archaeon]|nr:MAG: hypothetical protein DRJ56_06575 [Thermoprotei archaeon]
MTRRNEPVFALELSAAERVFREAGLKPRPHQLEASQGVGDALKAGLDVLLVAPTGFGKTLAVLAALKAGRHLPALWLVRSLEVCKRVMEDALLVGLKPFAAAGRERTCPLASTLGSAVHAWCRVNRARCERYLELLKGGATAPAALSWEDLLGGDVCPYYAQDLYARGADIVVQSYYRRPYPAAVTVVDECHNVVTPRERKLSLATVAKAVAELRVLGRTELAEEVMRLAGLSRSAPLERLPLAELEMALVEAVQRLREVMGLPRLVGAVRTCQFGGAAYREPWEDYVTVYEPPWRPRGGPVVYVTATMPRGLEDLLGVQAEVRVPPERRLRAYVTTWLTTKYGEETWRGYAELLTKLRFMFRRVLAFATERVAIRLLDAVQYYEPELTEPPTDWEGVLLLHSRGRFAEGVDLPADCVVILGAPYLPPEVSARLRKAYRLLGAPEDAAFSVPVLVTTLQCIGRAARSPEQRPVVVLADQRFERFEKELGEYLEIRDLADLKELDGAGG